VGVLEAGKRWPLESVPKSNWDIPKWLWLPGLKLVGPQRLTMLRNTFVVSARGVGGGSLIYGCTLYDPLEKFYTDAQWAHITDWRAELAPYYDQAKRMLGSASNPQPVPSDDVLREVAEDMGVGDTYHPTEVGVFFGEPGKTVPDPYFGGVGPDRTGCLFCSDCMIGCRYGAKNTTPQNYLYLAERAGAAVHELTTVTAVRPPLRRPLRHRNLKDGTLVQEGPPDVRGRPGDLRGSIDGDSRTAARAQGPCHPARPIAAAG